jgi:hypothetical protein
MKLTRCTLLQETLTEAVNRYVDYHGQLPKTPLDLSNLYVQAIAEPRYLRSSPPSHPAKSSRRHSAYQGGGGRGAGAYSKQIGWGWERQWGENGRQGDDTTEYVYESPML